MRRGDADCHASDIGHWFAMTTLWQSEVRRGTDCRASDIGHWFAMTGMLGLARGEDGAGQGGGGYFRLRRKRRMRRTRAARQRTACRAESI